MFFTVFTTVICSLFVLLLIGKYYELLWVIQFLKRRGTKYSEEIIDNGLEDNRIVVSKVISIMKKYDFPMRKRLLFPTKIIHGIKPSFLRKIGLKFFHFHLLQILLGIILVLIIPEGILLIVSSVIIMILLTGICLQTFNLIWHQYILGTADLIQKSIGLAMPYWEREKYEFIWAPNQPFRDFIKLLLKTLVTFILSFMFIYFGINEIFIEVYSVGVFNNVSEHFLLRMLDMFYYSIGTITTAGTGNVVSEHFVLKIITSIEILSGISLLIVFALGFASNLQTGFKLKSPSDNKGD